MIHTEMVTVFCGNHRVEGSEQCDAGTGDKCCSDTCQLKPGVVCRCVMYKRIHQCKKVEIVF